ncbi:MAG TPA: NADPH-dependent FMN reductase [bacterium]|nr:NADPH-dependent FMN reductase [bacterium]
MTILTISGSLRPDAATTNLLRALALLAPPGIRLVPYYGPNTVPAFSPERDPDPAPPSVAAIRQQLLTADGVVIATPEYAYGMPGTLNNALDWLVSSASLYRKPVATLSASPSHYGGHHAHAGLRLTLTAHHARLSAGTALTVPHVRLKIAPDGALTDPAFTTSLRNLLTALSHLIQGPVAW